MREKNDQMSVRVVHLGIFYFDFQAGGERILSVWESRQTRKKKFLNKMLNDNCAGLMMQSKC